MYRHRSLSNLAIFVACPVILFMAGGLAKAQIELPCLEVQNEFPTVQIRAVPMGAMPMAIPPVADGQPVDPSVDPDADIAPSIFEADNADANAIWKNYQVKTDTQKQFNDIQKKLNEEAQAKRKLKFTLAAKLYDQRMEELAKVKPKADPDFSKLGLTIFDFPELDGSESCQNLGMLVVCRTLEVPYTWDGKPDPEKLPDPNASRPYRENSQNSLRNRRVHQSQNWNFRYNNRWQSPDSVVFSVQPDTSKTGERTKMFFEEYFGDFIGSNGAYLSLIGPRKRQEGESDPYSGPHYPKLCPAEIIIVDRKPTFEEEQAIEQAEVELDIQPLGYDALVFIVNRRNPVDNMKSDDLREFFQMNQNGGAPTFNWKDFGGPDRNVIAFDHQYQAGFREILDSALFQIEGGQNRYYGRQNINQQNIEAISGTIGGNSQYGNNSIWGITYTLHSWQHFAAAGEIDVKTLSVDGVAPGLNAILSKKYPFITPIYVVTRKDIAPDSRAAKLRDWLLTTNGQRLVLESGYIPVRSKD